MDRTKAKEATVFMLNYRYHYYDCDGDTRTWAIYDSKNALLADLEPSFLKDKCYSEEEVRAIKDALKKNDGYYDPDDMDIYIEERIVYTLGERTGGTGK